MRLVIAKAFYAEPSAHMGWVEMENKLYTKLPKGPKWRCTSEFDMMKFKRNYHISKETSINLEPKCLNNRNYDEVSPEQQQAKQWSLRYFRDYINYQST